MLTGSIYAQIAPSCLDRKINIPRQNTSLYEALNLIAAQTGCSFIYDSRLVDNNRKVKVYADNQTVKDVLAQILSDQQLKLKVLDSHILICRDSEKSGLVVERQVKAIKDSLSGFFTIKGHIHDNLNQDPVAYATIGCSEANLGTITNNEGMFILKLPLAFRKGTLVISHLGYLPQQFPIEIFEDNEAAIYLERRIISIQEVIIRYTDPKEIIKKALSERSRNNAADPVYVTSFYREGVLKNERLLSYSEAVIKQYKTGFDAAGEDMVKALKSRKLKNVSKKDTTLLKLKGGIEAGLQLDLVKNLPAFLNPEEMDSYTYTYSDIVSYDTQDAYAIEFEPKVSNGNAVFRGSVFISRESYAILGADFEIEPSSLDQVAGDFIQKKTLRLKVKFEQIKYSVSYLKINGVYYLNHARSDLVIRTRHSRRFGTDLFHTFMEVASCKIDTEDVQRFPNKESINPSTIFSDIPYVYDEAFWEEYNFILPEASLDNALSKLISHIEEIE
ncbi:MAG: carboxypeptidase-like regulatory domain-containing protein [Bacteroidales bacterium]|nr:carboxypeptidase-like regulatory domain-containing protein [Bacteroidales bacterium]